MFESVSKMSGKLIKMLMEFSGIVDWLSNSSLNGGDVLNSGGILTFDLRKLRVMIKAPKLFM